MGKIRTCCDALIEALEYGSDNEGWGSLLRLTTAFDYGMNELPVGPRMGSVLTEIKYCPWCGTPIEVEEEN